MNTDKIINEIETIKELNDQLLDHSYNLLQRLMIVCRKNNISIDPETKGLLADVRKTLGKMHIPPDEKHPFKNTRRFNRTKNLCCDLKIY